MRPLVAADGTPLVAPDGTPLIGESENCLSCGCTTNGCTNCECLKSTTSPSIALEVSGVPLELNNGAESEACGFVDNLAGYKPLRGLAGCSVAANSLCNGIFEDPCATNTPVIRGLYYAANGFQPYDPDGEYDPVFYENDCAVYEHFWRARWFVALDKATGTLSVFLAFHWFGGRGCPSSCASLVVSYVRWEYEFRTCDQLSNPVHIRTMMWNAWGSSPTPATSTVSQPIECLCDIEGPAGFYDYIVGSGAIAPGEKYPDEWPASAGNWVGTHCAVQRTEDDLFPAVAAPANGSYYTLKDITPPTIRITGCENACCGTEGGPPVAAINILSLENCLIRAEDVSTPGTCGAISRRAWLLEQWSEDPGGEPVCPERQSVFSSDEYGLEYTDIVALSASGCGAKWARLTLLIWDESNCFSSASTGVFTCCSCLDGLGNICTPEPSGSLVITLLNETECLYRLSATTGAGGVCSETVIIEYWLSSNVCASGEECTCKEIEDGDCGGVGCSGTLGNGQHIDLTLLGGVTVFWRAREASCGCFGTKQSENIVCGACGCCDGAIQGMYITIAGLANTEGRPGCNCSAANGTYFIPANLLSGCGGQANWPLLIFCPNPVIEESFNLDITWTLTCNPDTGEYLLHVSFGIAFDGSNQYESSGSVSIPFDCSTLGGGLTRTVAGVTNICDGATATVEAEVMYLAA